MDSKHTLNKHPVGHPYGVSLSCDDKMTLSSVPHRELTLKDSKIFMDFTVGALQTHHISEDCLDIIKKEILSLKIKGLDASILSPYPPEDTNHVHTRKSNFAEVVMTEYLKATTSLGLPIYKLRYNPNVRQSMKGDDTLLFDLYTNPVRIIVGESKFRKTSCKEAVGEIISGLVRSAEDTLPVSLPFVYTMLFKQGKVELARKVLDCVHLILENAIKIEYVGFLLSNEKVSGHVEEHTTNKLSNLSMISLGVPSPENMVHEAFERLEGSL